MTAVLFDLDGTLLDTAPDLRRALNEVLAAQGLPLKSLDEVRPHATHGTKSLLNLGFGEGAFERQELREAFWAAYLRDISQETRLFPGVAELVAALNAAAIPWGIVTNKITQLTVAALPHFPELDACQALVCGDTLAERKPHPAPLLHAAALLGSDPRHCLYLGDALTDMEAARDAGMQGLVASWGYVDQDHPHWPARAVLARPQALLEWCKISRSDA
ncbi:HAD-IA family hydrolase [Gallaecimonas kandeliae]|uniref:HAD family hydrolase n=1 Tax=Gallaecimonas kandeliae TaxID=3029055 RepID=UPI0026483855|nr:HAD-IA family hydrolase [Gallaecimonas kandeliae]WKE63980.1 HAD-IA family hydrolase [Gallaecimonas kandeliae]